jgi:caffeoyl-CoA O-methyltransferase
LSADTAGRDGSEASGEPGGDRAAAFDAGSDRVAAYIEALFAPEDELLADLRSEIPRRGLPAIHVSPAEGKLLQVLLAAVGARRVLEIGTLGGYSAIRMARALPPGGRLVTLDRDPRAVELARDFAARAGLAGVIEVRSGEAVVSLAAMADAGEAPFDACFIDADKANYPEYLRWARRLVRPGGLVLGDNALWSGRVLDDPPSDADTAAIQRFNRELAGASDFVASIIPIRDGLAVGVLRPAPAGPTS